MPALDIAKTKFDPTLFDHLPVEQLPLQISTWSDLVISYLKETPDFDESIQAFVVTELNSFLAYIEPNAAVISKPIRLQVSYAYQLVYTSKHHRFLPQVVNNLVKIVGSSKTEKFPQLKQYVPQRLLVYLY